MAKIEILESAQRELEAIAELHMNLVGPNSARKITDRILDSLSRLERFPLSGSLPRDAELLKSGYRYVIAGQYLCVYRRRYFLGDEPGGGTEGFCVSGCPAREEKAPLKGKS